MNLTAKQIELLRVIGERNPDGSAADLDQILERLQYKPTKFSLQFSIRALIAHGLIQKDAPEKRRGRNRAILSLTDLGKAMTGRGSGPAMVVDPETEAFLAEFSDLLSE